MTETLTYESTSMAGLKTKLDVRVIPDMGMATFALSVVGLSVVQTTVPKKEALAMARFIVAAFSGARND